MNAEHYAEQLKALLPPGDAWPREAGAELPALIDAVAEEFARLDARVEDLLDELDPRTTGELLLDWERVAGLPDDCITVEQTTGERRAALIARLVNTGDQSRAYFIALAADAGYDIAITEFHPHDVEDDVEHPLYGDAWAFAWQVESAFATVTELDVESGVDDPLAAWQNEQLECLVEELKPAHTHVIFAYQLLNDIGIAGEQGFGVGIYPEIELPEGFGKFAGTEDSTSGEYGNYQYSDGSVMCWIPAFYYKWGTGANGLALNVADVKPLGAYFSVAAANADGYALHRAFYDGGAVKKGFFVDKYLCSNNGGVASSIANGAPLSSHSTHNPFAGLDGAPTNQYWGALVAAKTRGPEFFCSSRFIFAALALLSYAHGKAATLATWCAWYDGAGVINFPKGNNNNALKDANDATVTFTTDGFDDGSGNGAQDSSLTGSGVPFAKTTHNGQASGVCDLNGNMWEITPGLVTDTGGASFFILKTSAAMKDVTGGNTLATDLWGAPGIAALYDELGATFQEALATSTLKRFGTATQVLAHEVSGNNWQWAGLGAPLLGGADGVGTDAFGKDAFYDYRVANLCPISGADWANGSIAGVWALHLSLARTSSDIGVGFRAASYL